jgi:DNA-binding winged helix-turn-helix (wHTH) protein
MKTENAGIGSESQDAMTSIHPQRVRIGPFEADLETHELWKNGIKVKLGGQLFEILAVLLNRPGQLVTREELQKEIWAADTFVDFNHGLTAAVNKLRETLSDCAEEPLPRRGYRFIGRIENAVSELKPEGAMPPEGIRCAATSDGNSGRARVDLKTGATSGDHRACRAPTGNRRN